MSIVSKQRPKDITVAWRLFHERYRCTIPQHYLISEVELQERGFYSTNNRQKDRSVLEERREIGLSTVGMVMYHSEGAVVKLLDPKDAIPIYRMLNDHLLTWKHILNTEFNVNDAPIEDLRKMDEFALAIFPLANQFNEFKPRARGIFEQLDNLRRRSPITLGEAEKPQTEHAKVVDANMLTPATINTAAHNNLNEAIKRHMFRMRENGT